MKNARNSNDLITNKVSGRWSTLDSNWSFHPFGVNLSPGISLPLGKFSEFVKPAFGFGFTFTLRFTKSLSLEFGMMVRFMNNKKPVDIKYQDSLISTNIPEGANFGGWIHYNVIRNRHIYTDLIGGFSREYLSTEYETIKDEDTITVGVKTFGCAFGIQNWFACFGHQNIGLKLFYQFVPYNRDKILISKLGGQTLTLAVIYRFPKRESKNFRYAWLN